MTDKEKIRAEIERLMNELIQEKEKGYGSDIDDVCILEYQNILSFIDSLQEEPKFKVGQTIKKDGFNNGFTISKIEDGFYYNTVGDYFPVSAQEQWELVEEPVSEEISALLPCLYNRTLEERIETCKYCSAACEGRVKDVVSDDLDMDLEKEIDRYWNSLPIGVVYRPHWGPFQQIARHFVEWQEKKDKAENDAIKKLLKDFDKQYDEGFITGQKLLRKQMIGKVCDWLDSNAQKYIAYELASATATLTIGQLIEDFRKAMEKGE